MPQMDYDIAMRVFFSPKIAGLGKGEYEGQCHNSVWQYKAVVTQNTVHKHELNGSLPLKNIKAKIKFLQTMMTTTVTLRV